MHHIQFVGAIRRKNFHSAATFNHSARPAEKRTFSDFNFYFISLSAAAAASKSKSEEVFFGQTSIYIFISLSAAAAARKSKSEEVFCLARWPEWPIAAAGWKFLFCFGHSLEIYLAPVLPYRLQYKTHKFGVNFIFSLVFICQRNFT